MNEQVKSYALAAAQKIIRHKYQAGECILLGASFQVLEHDGASGNELFRFNSDWSAGGVNLSIRVIAKKWQEQSWVTQLLSSGAPVENLLYENGIVDLVVNETCIHVPILGGYSTEDEHWIFLEDIREELEAWKAIDTDHDSAEAERLLIESMARFHVKSESSRFQNAIQANQDWLVSQETRLRWFEVLSRVWWGDLPIDQIENAAVKQAIQNLEWARVYSQTFLDYLSASDLRIWLELMQDRDSLIESAADLPQVLLHGDLTRRNIGLSPQDDRRQLIWIDWEIAGVGTPIFDLVHFMCNPLRPISARFELLDDYYHAYQFQGGQFLDESNWKKSCDLALVHYGITLIPCFAGMLLKENTENTQPLIDQVVGRIKLAVTDQGLVG